MDELAQMDQYFHQPLKKKLMSFLVALLFNCSF